MAAPDDALVLTPNGIPVSLRPYLQEYTLESLDPSTAEHVLMARTLEYGGRQELRWLFRQYGRARIAEWVRQYGYINLTPVPFNFWRIVLEVEDYMRRDVTQSAWHNRLSVRP